MIIAIDVGGTNLEAALISKGKIIKKQSIPTEAKKGKRIVLKNILKVIDSVFDKKSKAICVATAGPFVNFEKRTVSTSNLPLKNFSFKKFLYNNYRKKVFVDNDANCFTLGEAVYGSGKKFNTVFGITLGTGIGGGLVVDKKIYHGRGNALEICYMIMNFRESIERISQKLKDRQGYIRNFERLGYYLGFALVNYITLFDPDIVVFGGNISYYNWDKFEGSMLKVVKERYFGKSPLIIKTRLKNAALLGAYSLAQ